MKLLGGILIAVGILVAGASGLCSLAMFGSMVASGSRASTGFLGEAGGALLMVLVVGGIPFLIGIGLIIAGRNMIRTARDE